MIHSCSKETYMKTSLLLLMSLFAVSCATVNTERTSDVSTNAVENDFGSEKYLPGGSAYGYNPAPINPFEYGIAEGGGGFFDPTGDGGPPPINQIIGRPTINSSQCPPQ